MLFDWLEPVSYLTWYEWCQTFDIRLTYSLNNRKRIGFSKHPGISKDIQGFQRTTRLAFLSLSLLDHLSSCPGPSLYLDVISAFQLTNSPFTSV